MTTTNPIPAAGPRVAVVGGGIVGIILTLALSHRNVSVRLYEQAERFREVGAGIAFSASARRCSTSLTFTITMAGQHSLELLIAYL